MQYPLQSRSLILYAQRFSAVQKDFGDRIVIDWHLYNTLFGVSDKITKCFSGINFQQVNNITQWNLY